MVVTIQIRYVKHHQKINDLYRMLEECRIDDKLIQLFVTLSPKTDLSPRGLITLLMLTHDLVSEYKPFASKFFDENCFKVLIGLLR
jgi:fused-like protein